jgi:hypothetical protein
MQTWED